MANRLQKVLARLKETSDSTLYLKGQTIWARDFNESNNEWYPATVIKKFGDYYQIKYDEGDVRKIHGDYLKIRKQKQKRPNETRPAKAL